MIVLIMGVSGSGKSTVAGMVAESLGADYLDADDFHPPANVAKMTRGYPLTDDDRIPWLRAVNARLRQLQQSGSDAVLACSALTQRYRDMLTQGLDTVYTICLHGSPETIAQRIASRKGHFMPPALLQSQLDTLEIPSEALLLDIELPTSSISKKIIDYLLT